jgi:glyoxylase-like metal-dependent hydrolase (beta-lactamase superfamily II)
MSGAPAVIGSLEPWFGGEVAAGVCCVLAPNPSAMTLDGTNTWILWDNGPAVIVDPGPADSQHLAAVVAELTERELVPAEILLTHGHADHSAGAQMFAAQWQIPVRALDPQHRLGSEGLSDGESVRQGDLELQVIATPGHTADSLSFHLPQGDAVLTGDTVLGRGTSVVAWPDGSLTDYLMSLQRLQQLAVAHPLEQVLPGHGPALDRPASLLADYLAHREERLDQVRAAIAAGAESVVDIVERVYQPLPAGVWPAARASAAAQWEHLHQLGEVAPPSDWRG